MYTNLKKWILRSPLLRYVKSLCCHLLKLPDNSAVAEVVRLRGAMLVWPEQENVLRDLVGKVTSYESSGAWRSLEAYGLSPQMSRAQSRRNYLKIVRELHPDRGGDPQRFAAFQTAYESVVEN